MFSFVKNEKESSRESCERAKGQLREGWEREREREREGWERELREQELREREGWERALRESWERAERELKRAERAERELRKSSREQRAERGLKKSCEWEGSHIHSLGGSYILCPPKGEAAVRLLWFSFWNITVADVLLCYSGQIRWRKVFQEALNSDKWQLIVV